IEVQFDDLTRVFFCRVLDHPPELEEIESDGVVMLVEPEYTKAEYLSGQDHVVITPVEPSIGNFLICSVNRVLLRLLGSRCAFEFGCFFNQKIRVRGMPILQCSFPLIARQVKGARAYRAKIPREMELLLHVERQGKRENFSSCPIDISVEGMLLVDPFGKYSDLKEEEKIWMELYWPKDRSLRVNARVIHVSQLRDKSGIQYCCGIQFDLATRALARDIEQLVAGVQRRRLRELSDISDEFGVDFNNW
ncbi:MAG TPA: PilZ domain-containing protein, partial [Desulfobulbaceae bacterium]|nr:PilZ domain-containing protein [Desulfobulbaceae bacterium]